jgi:hypothetical protein
MEECANGFADLRKLSRSDHEHQDEEDQSGFAPRQRKHA